MIWRNKVGENNANSFVMFSGEHLAAIAALCFCLWILFTFEKKLSIHSKNSHLYERFFALSLLAMEIAYHLVLIRAGEWSFSESLPIHLCSFSLFCSSILLWTGNRKLYDFVFFAGVGGAIQAVLTPSLEVNFPDFKFLQFFYVHFGIILTGFYILRTKGYRPTFNGIIKTMITLNLLLPVIFFVNILVQGNYMFLKEKPVNGSLLDLLGPYPWYTLSLEFVAFLMFVVLWLIFRSWKRPKKKD